MKTTYLLGGVLCAGLMSSLVLAAPMNSAASKQQCLEIIQSVKGSTYKMVKRTLADGTVQSGADVKGTLTYTKNGYRIIAVDIKSGHENQFNASIQSRYTLSPTTYSHAVDALAIQSAALKPFYQYNQPAKSVPVSCVNGKVVIAKPPYDPVKNVIITKTGLTATYVAAPLKGAVDEWVRIPG